MNFFPKFKPQIKILLFWETPLIIFSESMCMPIKYFVKIKNAIQESKQQRSINQNHSYVICCSVLRLLRV